jgi:hypothetical protein
LYRVRPPPGKPPYSEFKNVTRFDLSAELSALYRFVTAGVPQDGLSRVKVRPSCMSRLRVRNPHSGAVRIRLAVGAKSSVGWIGIPSLVPMSCSR